MLQMSIENYCFLDDATRHFEFQELNSTLELYLSTLVTYPNESKTLIIARPKGASDGWKDLQKFLLENVEDRQLVACRHYSRYIWLVNQYSPEFVCRSMITKPDFDEDMWVLFKYADKIVHYAAEILRQNFTDIEENEHNRKKILDAVRDRKDRMTFGLEMLLRGFH